MGVGFRWLDCVWADEIWPLAVAAISNADANAAPADSTERSRGSIATTENDANSKSVAADVWPTANRDAEGNAGPDSGEAGLSADAANHHRADSAANHSDARSEGRRSAKPSENASNRGAGSAKTHTHAGSASGHSSLSRPAARELKRQKVPSDCEWEGSPADPVSRLAPKGERAQ